MNITALTALELLDSRGNPTVGACLTLADGTQEWALVPSGASTGEKEAVELRDGDPARYQGKGVRQAVGHVQGEIAQALVGQAFDSQQALDQALIALDGTPNKARLGANALLAVSMAFARASATSSRQPLYRYLDARDAYLMPVPCLNVLNGGRHADNTVDFQEFMIAPHHASSFAESIRMGAETFHSLKQLLKQSGYSTGIGDEGGFAPDLRSNEEAVELILKAIEQAGYRPGDDISICLDPATSEMWNDGGYVFFKSGGRRASTQEMIDLWQDWVRKYPIVLLEDGLAENDWAGWQLMTQLMGQQLELVGDDIFCTNPDILKQGIEQQVANSVLIKLNQIGTVSETLETIQLAREHGYAQFISHRSGETEDTFIADLTVASGAGHLKTGSACRSERVAKFNRLLRIEHELGSQARFAGKQAFKLG
ncbi:MAG: phosphopyruvate hydratase [Candidatus Melainabacteria bacterium HGW-Melainabacteria-1]|nr:MAG: phosphopyruvate hydratase [Candidatus Melainabacteria bacterium HGW-Melainabacteria-1]